MQSSFIIDPPGYTDTELIIEISEETISCCWINTSTKILEGLHTWKYEKVKELASILDNLEHKPSKSHISYITREYFLYPKNEGMDPAAAIDDVFGKLPGVIYEKKLRGGADDVMIAFRIPVGVDEIIKTHFPGADVQHSLSCNYSKTVEANISLVFYERQFTARIYQNGLKLLNLYSYNSPGEVAYILLHACDVYNLDPSACIVIVSGLIDENSKLYTELYRFFLNIDFANPGRQNFSEGFSSYPVHYFDHYHSLASCGS